ncbi:hypothetical protein PF002_g28241 [Phytophthora fragariae]|uniref:NAD(P)-binding domain-containing protein n=3 Tax=Phytophthora TaxID=4783 RepID=A0A6A3PXT3_9STRA|nr:hypothetical protein PF009_g31509 [Phytophthora fragariae]KAE9064121.1 hypothetical protein PF006_g30775 [Phytophthora fragariae]KAE9177801.1 hypothetical protein PF002_g28241 [Phytophthora fragariae]
MPKYVLTGADGNLGGVAADFAVEIAKPEDELVFTSYTLDSIPADKLKRWQDKGVKVVAASYDEPETLKPVFQGAEAVSFISTWLIGDRRRSQAKNVIDTAKACGVKRICYTSFVGAGSTAENEEDIPFLPRDHHFVEQQIYASGLQYSIQRNFLDDCGRVQAALLLGRGEPNHVYDVTGPEAVSHEEIFDFMCKETGYKAEFVDMSDEKLKKYWLGRGLPVNVYGDFSQMRVSGRVGWTSYTFSGSVRRHFSSGPNSLPSGNPLDFHSTLQRKQFSH